MSFRLLKTLRLEDVTIRVATNQPTKKFMREVINIEAPLTRDVAAVLEFEHAVFDKAGVAYDFRSPITWPREISGPQLTFATEQRGEMAMTVEKVVNWRVTNDPKTGIEISATIHLPELERDVFLELIGLIYDINDTSFELRIEPQQASLLNNNDPLVEGESWQKTSIKHGRRIMLIVGINTGFHEGKYVSGWELQAPGWREIAPAGEALEKAGEHYATQKEAGLAAARELYRHVKNELPAEAPAELQAVADFCDWIYTVNPALQEKVN